MCDKQPPKPDHSEEGCRGRTPFADKAWSISASQLVQSSLGGTAVGTKPAEQVQSR